MSPYENLLTLCAPACDRSWDGKLVDYTVSTTDDLRLRPFLSVLIALDNVLKEPGFHEFHEIMVHDAFGDGIYEFSKRITSFVLQISVGALEHVYYAEAFPNMTAAERLLLGFRPDEIARRSQLCRIVAELFPSGAFV